MLRLASASLLPIYVVKKRTKTSDVPIKSYFWIDTLAHKMSVQACKINCGGPFAELSGSRSSSHRCPNYEARDEKRFASVAQRLRVGSQQSAVPASREPMDSPTHQENWPPLKPRSHGSRISDPLPRLPSTTRAPGNLTGFSSPTFCPPKIWGGQSLPRPAFPAPPSHGPIAPASVADKRRISSN